jgi:hypothetical protein
MYLLLKNSLFVILILFIYGCDSTKSNFVKTNDINSVSIETSGDRDNILFKEHLIRIFNTKRNAIPKFKLKATISFSSSDTLTVSGLNALSRTLANVSYKLYNFKSKKLIKSGSITSFPALGSTSNSLYTNDVNLKYIKDRLNVSISKKLYLHLNIFLRRLK